MKHWKENEKLAYQYILITETKNPGKEVIDDFIERLIAYQQLEHINEKIAILKTYGRNGSVSKLIKDLQNQKSNLEKECKTE